MPSYRNDTNAKITHQGKNNMEWQPGEEKSLVFFVPYKDLGLTLASPEPYVRKSTGVYDYQEFEIAPNGMLVYEIPYHETFELSLSARVGSVSVRIGDGEAKTILDTLHDHVSTYAWDQTGWLTFEGLNSEIAQIIVKVEAKTWRDAKKMGRV